MSTSASDLSGESREAGRFILREILRNGKERLEAAAIQSVDAELLLAHLLGVGRMDLHAREFTFTDEEESELR